MILRSKRKGLKVELKHHSWLNDVFLETQNNNGYNNYRSLLSFKMKKVWTWHVQGWHESFTSPQKPGSLQITRLLFPKFGFYPHGLERLLKLQ